MIKIVSSIAFAGLMGLTLASPLQAQERALRRATAGEPAALQKSMTEGQARRACRQEMSGSRESRSSINKKMPGCINGKMNGN